METNTTNENTVEQKYETEPTKKRPKKKKRHLKKGEENYVSASPLMYDEKTNPCIKEEKLSSKCMYLNNYDKHRCEDAFLNYRECTSFWRWVRVHRFWHNKYPLLPETEEERRKIKEEYWNMEKEKHKEMMEYLNRNTSNTKSNQSHE